MVWMTAKNVEILGTFLVPNPTGTYHSNEGCEKGRKVHFTMRSENMTESYKKEERLFVEGVEIRWNSHLWVEPTF